MVQSSRSGIGSGRSDLAPHSVISDGDHHACDALRT